MKSYLSRREVLTIGPTPRRCDEIVGKYAAIIAPTSASGAGLIEPAPDPNPPNPNAGQRPNGGGSSRGPAAALTRVGNLAGLPGISIPCGFDNEGMPLGLQIVAKAWDDQATLDVAMAFQRDTDFHLKRPAFRS